MRISAPTRIQFLTTDNLLALEWADGAFHRIPFQTLRQMCPCAVCVSEVTGERLLDPDTIADDINPIRVNYSGNYTLKIEWSDSHDSGLFTWEFLHKIGVTIAHHEAGNGN